MFGTGNPTTPDMCGANTWDLFKFLSVNIGNLTSFSSIVNYFKSKQKKTNYETISTYVGFLKDTFIIHQAERFNLRGKQLLGGECKYYLNDLSFKNYLLGNYPSDIGNHLETFVYLQLRRMGYKVSVGVFNNNRQRIRQSAVNQGQSRKNSYFAGWCQILRLWRN